MKLGVRVRYKHTKEVGVVIGLDGNWIEVYHKDTGTSYWYLIDYLKEV